MLSSAYGAKGYDVVIFIVICFNLAATKQTGNAASRLLLELSK